MANIELSYLDRKAVKHALEKQLHIRYAPVLEYASKVDQRVYTAQPIDQDIVEWTRRKAAAGKRLLDVKAKYIQALQTLVELKLGSRQVNDAKLAQIELESIKAKAE